jgi:hypothetical protein
MHEIVVIFMHKYVAINSAHEIWNYWDVIKFCQAATFF